MMSRSSSVRLLLQGIRRVNAALSSSSSRGCTPSQNVCFRSISTIPLPTAKRLEGKMAIIIGAASGIGETTARLFAAHGARVLIADVQNAENLARELGSGSEFIHCDVRNEEHVAAAVDKGVLMGEGRVDVFHHNAGILGAVGPIDETRMAEFDYTMAVNIRGAFLGVKHAARVMKPAKKGSIICTGSVAGAVGGLGPHAYTISKTAMVGLVRSASVELRGFGIRVNMISPDGAPTNVLAQAVHMLECEPLSLDLAERKAKEFSPLPDHSLSTLDVAQAALFIATEDSGFISGHNLMVDCGNTVTKPYDNARWYTTHSPLFREAAKTVITAESVGQYAGGFEELNFRWAPDSTALICFTSGTTGKPKGVALSHSALIVQSLTKIALIGYNCNDVYLHTSPLCHIGGISSALALVMAGGCHVFVPKFEAASTMNAIQKHSVTAMITIPTMLADIVAYCNHSRSKDGGLELCFPTVKKILNGAGSLSPQLLKSAIALFPRAQFFSAYGMTEACSSMTFMVSYDPMIGEDTARITQKLTMALHNPDVSRDHAVGVCVGKPAPHVEIQIEPSNTFLYGNEVYNVGNILTKGPHVMQKYWGQEEATAAAFRENRWLNTGDAGWIDKEGRLWLLGRSKDMIKSGGENVYPSEVEEILLNHPGILAVVVVGIPDSRLNELVTASIQLHSSWQWKDENLAMQSQANNILSPRLLQLYCKQKGLSGFKVPRIFFPQRQPFPRTTTGKVKKDAVKTEILLKLQRQPYIELTVARSSL